MYENGKPFRRWTTGVSLPINANGSPKLTTWSASRKLFHEPSMWLPQDARDQLSLPFQRICSQSLLRSKMHRVTKPWTLLSRTNNCSNYSNNCMRHADPLPFWEGVVGRHRPVPSLRSLPKSNNYLLPYSSVVKCCFQPSTPALSGIWAWASILICLITSQLRTAYC